MLDTLLAVCGMTTTGLKVPEIEAGDIWASDCLNTGSLGLLSAGINPFTLPHQNRADRFSPSPPNQNHPSVPGGTL